MLDNKSVRPRMKAKIEEACEMRVKGLKKMHLRGTICKGRKKGGKNEETRDMLHHTATINMFSQINGVEEPLDQ